MSKNVTLDSIQFEKLMEQAKVARVEYLRQHGMATLVVVGSTLRARHVTAVVAVILISFGVKMFFFSPPTAEADMYAARSASLTSATMSDVTAASQTSKFAPVCAAREVSVITLLEDLSKTQNIAPEKTAVAVQTFLQARTACYAGRVSDAVALYESILSLGPALAQRSSIP